MGHKITKHGLQIDEDKIEAIKKMKAPSNIKEAIICIGMSNYFGL